MKTPSAKTPSTLRDVARRSGVSPATVSNVLNNRSSRTSPETRRNVLNAIRELNYRPGAMPGPNPQAARTIGIFLWLGNSAPLTTNPYALTVLDGILTVTLAGHWNTTLISVQNWEDARAQVRLYADGRCDGFLLIGPSRRIAIPDALRERDYPFVTIGGSFDDPQGDSVNIDNFAAAYALTSFLTAQGHTRIAYLIGDEDMEDVTARVEGYRCALAEAGVAEADRWIVRPGAYNIPASSRLLAHFWDHAETLPPEQRPTALLCGNDQLADNAARLLRERGVRIPQDLSITGFDDTPYATLADPPITTMRQPLFELGRRGAEILVQRLDEKSEGTAKGAPGVIKDVLAHTLVVRASVAPPEPISPGARNTENKK